MKQLMKNLKFKLMDIIHIGISVSALQDILEWQYFQNIYQYQLLKIFQDKASIANKVEL